jgi:hypothetical protein
VKTKYWGGIGFNIWSKEDCAAMIAGIGVGMILSRGIPNGHLILPASIFCIAAGGLWARALEKKRLQKESPQKESASPI